MEKKIKKVSLVLAIVVSIIALWNIGLILYSLIGGGILIESTAFIAIQYIGSGVNMLLMLSLLTLSLILLFSIKKSQTLFNLKIVRLLQGIAIVMMVSEPLDLIFQGIRRSFSLAIATASSDGPTSVFGLISVIIVPTFFIFVAGLIVFCISLVIKHGITLQKQVDETL